MSFCANIPNNELRCLDIREKLANPFYISPKYPCYTEYNNSKAALVAMFTTILLGALFAIPLCLQLKESSRRNWSQLSPSEKTKLILKKSKVICNYSVFRD